ncbi:transporter substrate-binding domain-containing protein [Roseiflexus castenholzii]|uniref:Extracellular solute-binding protein family 3 n=1 Tax=Roseiflexus castenholzii (strain DSM 13941 / HLO8) TaxID=383372 RepID=A7NL95_ROSCS|nr:transporter substrate-binding domain-containing protein [Roseiflexus castenholzii]ABU58268.1 extracellular solute-binding protein family 3 [Roseiflexus castenholzii DSM 13941]
MKKQMLLIVTLIAAILAISACGGAPAAQPTQPAAQPTQPAAQPTQPAAQPTQPATQPEGKLAQIRAAGKLIVGTSADYPPYESIDANGNFVGFDMDLIRAVGEKLGVQVEIRDMPFDSLIASLQEGKIDAVIAAMQATAEREEKVDFTIPYRMTKDAFIGAGDTTIVMSKPEDAAGMTIGAQTGTVQEGWIQKNLVATGLTPADKVFSYERADQAALDLASGRLQLVLMDAEPALELAQKNNLKVLLVTETTAEGGKSIAIPEGAGDLKAELDRIIQGLIDDGTVKALEEKHGLP